MMDDASLPTADTPPTARDDPAALAAWRHDGAHRLDPVRFSFLEALARRAAGLTGAARQLLDDKLAQGVAAYGERLKAAGAGAGAGETKAVTAHDAPVSAPRAALPSQARASRAPARSKELRTPHASATERPSSPRGLLADIVELLGHDDALASGPITSVTTSSASSSPTPASLLTTAPPDLKTLSYFRDTWTRLSADQRLTQALEQVPENAGPLNSQHLVHRALATMRDTSPAYLQQFVSYVDALLWMDQVHSQAFVVPGREAKPEARKKAAGRTG
jgi:hypothetical protein